MTRRALLDAAGALLDTGGPDAVTLREVGARTGVSRSAPYRHFANKETLLTALATNAMNQLGDTLERLAIGDDPPEQSLRAALLSLVAIGRAPRTYDVGLDKTSIQVDRGFVPTNEWMETTEPGVYAIGDVVAGLPQLAHVGAMSGLVVAAKLSGKYARPVRRDRIPGCTYTDPSIGSVGLTEAQAKEKGYQVKVGKFPFVGNSKATILDSHDGFVKVVADAKYGEILGVHIIGPGATEIIAECVTAMELEATVESMMFTIHAHPTLSESLLDGFSSVEGMAINV